jgi:hypothetical protein
VTNPVLHPRAGGEAYVAGTYYSESFARAICRRFQQRDFFSTVERRKTDEPTLSTADGSVCDLDREGRAS